MQQLQVAAAAEAFYDGRLPEARSLLEALLQTNPGWPAILLVLAHVYYQQSEPEKALTCLLQVQETANFIDGYEALLDDVSSQVRQSSS